MDISDLRFATLKGQRHSIEDPLFITNTDEEGRRIITEECDGRQIREYKNISIQCTENLPIIVTQKEIKCGPSCDMSYAFRTDNFLEHLNNIFVSSCTVSCNNAQNCKGRALAADHSFKGDPVYRGHPGHGPSDRPGGRPGSHLGLRNLVKMTARTSLTFPQILIKIEFVLKCFVAVSLLINIRPASGRPSSGQLLLCAVF